VATKQGAHHGPVHLCTPSDTSSDSEEVSEEAAREEEGKGSRTNNSMDDKLEEGSEKEEERALSQVDGVGEEGEGKEEWEDRISISTDEEQRNEEAEDSSNSRDVMGEGPPQALTGAHFAHAQPKAKKEEEGAGQPRTPRSRPRGARGQPQRSPPPHPSPPSGGHGGERMGETPSWHTRQGKRRREEEGGSEADRKKRATLIPPPPPGNQHQGPAAGDGTTGKGKARREAKEGGEATQRKEGQTTQGDGGRSRENGGST
jgi:hypothetical protein